MVPSGPHASADVEISAEIAALIHDFACNFIDRYFNNKDALKSSGALGHAFTDSDKKHKKSIVAAFYENREAMIVFYENTLVEGLKDWFSNKDPLHTKDAYLLLQIALTKNGVENYLKEKGISPNKPIKDFSKPEKDALNAAQRALESIAISNSNSTRAKTTKDYNLHARQLLNRAILNGLALQARQPQQDWMQQNQIQNDDEGKPHIVPAEHREAYLDIAIANALFNLARTLNDSAIKGTTQLPKRSKISITRATQREKDIDAAIRSSYFNYAVETHPDYTQYLIENIKQKLKKGPSKVKGKIQLEGATSFDAHQGWNPQDRRNSSPARLSEINELLIGIHSLLDELPPRTREIIVRIYGLDGKPPEEGTAIATKFNITSAAISITKVRALEKLQEAVERGALGKAVKQAANDPIFQTKAHLRALFTDELGEEIGITAISQATGIAEESLSLLMGQHNKAAPIFEDDQKESLKNKLKEYLAST